MKIVLLGPYPPYRGGISDTNQELCKNLIELGHDVEIFNFKLQYPSIFFPGKSQYSKTLNNNVLKSFKIINSINPYNWINVAKAINKLKPDILINSYWSPYFSPCFFTINKMVSKKIKKIGIIHNAFPHESILFQKHLFKLYVNSIDEFICFSNKVKEQINLLIPKKKGKTIFHPVHEKFGDVVEKEKARNKLKLKKNIKYILFFGIIRPYKGLDILLKSLDLVLSKEKNIELLIVGESYDSITKYKKIINDSLYKNKIHFFNNYIEDDDLKYWFSASDLVVQPYKKSSQSGITPLAFQFEVPTVVTDVGGLSEQITNKVNGFICKPNFRDLAEKIILALNFNKKLIVKEMKKQKEKLNWVNFTKSLLK